MKELLALAHNRQEYMLITALCAIPCALTFTGLADGSARKYVEARLEEFRALCF